MDLLMEILLLGIGLVIGLALRYLPHIIHFFPATSDVFAWFLLFRSPESEIEKIHYPKLFYKLFKSFLNPNKPLPERTLIRLIPLFDIGTAIILYLFLRGTFGAELSLLVMLIFLVTPIVIHQGIVFTARPLGLLFLTCSLLCLTLPFPFNWFAIIPATLTQLTHRLSTQTLFFISVAFSFFNWQAGAIFLASFGLTIVVSRGYYLGVLRNWIPTISRYFKGAHYPNRRIIGLFLTPTFLGLFAYLTVSWMQALSILPIVFFGFQISNATIVAPHFETLFLVWGIVCLLLVVFWLAGDSYRHLHFAGIPFAFFCAFLLQNGSIFLVLTIILVVACIVLSLILSIRVQHLDRDIVQLLSELSHIEECTHLLVPYHLLTAAKYYSRKPVIHVAFRETTREQVSSQIEKKKITHVVVDRSHYDWFPNLVTVRQIGGWYLLDAMVDRHSG